MKAKELIKYLRKNEGCEIYIATDENYGSYMGTESEDLVVRPLMTVTSHSKGKKLVLFPGVEEDI